jgi:hypothetical protein
MSTDNPILNSPYYEPKLHYATVATGSEKGALDYTKVVEGRRIFDPNSEGAIPTRQTNAQVEKGFGLPCQRQYQKESRENPQDRN